MRRTEPWEYEAAITPHTAGIAYALSADSAPALEEVITVARRHGLPVIVDAAGELPPRDNLQLIPATGADLVAAPGDLMAILEALREAGALKAELVVI